MVVERNMDENQLNAKLKNVPNYLGTFAINELDGLRIRSYPSYAIVNMDNRWETGSHWIGIGITSDSLFICDSLGSINKENIPRDLINFLHLFSGNRKLYISRQLQHINSDTCGFYVIFFVLFMQTHSFCGFLDSFGQDVSLNDLLVQIYCK